MAQNTSMKIDMHTHILPREIPNFAERFGYGDFISLLHHKPEASKDDERG